MGPDASQTLKKWRNVAYGTLSTVFFLIIWESGARLGWFNPHFYSYPTNIVRAFGELWRLDMVVPHLRASGIHLGVGLGLSLVVGIPLGILIGWYPNAYAFLNPFIAALYSTPRIALLPLLVLIFGIGVTTRVIIVFLSAVFPLIVATMAGVRTVDDSMLKVARVFRASDWQVFTTVALPGSVPFILTGLKLAIGRGLLGMVVAEFFLSNVGLGFLIQNSGTLFQVDRLFVPVVIIAVASIAMFALATTLERKFEPWRVGRDGHL